LETLGLDVRYGLRRLRMNPGFAISVIFIMALGIGSVAALFTIVYSVLLRPLPFPELGRLVEVFESDPQHRHHDTAVAGGTYKSWLTDNHSFDQLAMAYNFDYVNLTGAHGELPEHIKVEVGTWNLLSLLGVHPSIGRSFLRSDDEFGAAQTVIVSSSFWKRRLGGNASALGGTLILDGRPYNIVGVLPSWFSFPDAKIQLWIPLLPEVRPADHAMLESHDAHNFAVFGRLKHGISITSAEAELSRISARQGMLYRSPWVFGAAHLRSLLDSQVYTVKEGLYTLLGATVCVLLIACLNIMNLLVARAATSRREVAIRAALGSDRFRRIRASVVETLLLSLFASVLGIVLAYGILTWFSRLHFDLPRAESIHIDSLVIVVTILIATLCGLAAGLLPAAIEKDEMLLHSLRENSRSHSSGKSSLRLRKILIAVEISFTVVLLFGAGLLLKSYTRLRSVDFGINPQNMITMGISLPVNRYAPPARTIFFDQLLQRIRSTPGVVSAGLSTVVPGQGQGEDDGYTIHEDSALPKGEGLDAGISYIDPGYFASMQIPVISGRIFLQSERDERVHYAIINQTLARTVFAGRDPIGKHIDDPNNGLQGKSAPNEIIGVVGDTRDSAGHPVNPTIFFPLFGGGQSEATLAVRTRTDPLQFSTTIQNIIANIDPTLAVSDIQTMDEVIASSSANTNLQATLLFAFAVISLVLAAAGLFGVLSYMVASRTGELGIRMALGASRRQILWMIMRDGMQPAIPGAIVGGIASIALTRFIASMLYDTQPLDPVVILAVTVTLLLVSTAACIMPAWRASQMNPMETLRPE
jgi:predicted permease